MREVDCTIPRLLNLRASHASRCINEEQDIIRRCSYFSFDAVSRGFSYVYSRPWHYLWYQLVTTVYGYICIGFVILFAIMLTKQIGGDPKLTNTSLGLPAGIGLAVVTIGTLTYTALMAPWKELTQRSWEPTTAPRSRSSP